MARSDANGKEPTIDEINAASAAQFKGFSTTDGEVSDGTATPEEQAALAARAEQQRQSKQALNGGAPPIKNEGDEDEEGDDHAGETPEDKAAREAREAAMTPKQKAAAALQAKIGSADPKAKPADQKHRSANERIGKAVAAQRAVERELAAEREARARDRGEFEARLKALETRPLTGDGKPAITIDKDAPRATDYEFGELDAGYIRDLAVHETRKAIAAERTTQTAASQTEAQRREAQELKIKADKFGAAGLEAYDDFEEVVMEGAKNGDWPLSKTFGDLMFDSDAGTHIAYYLATHAKEATRIMGLSPTAQAAAFGRLEAAFSSTSSDATEQQEDQDETTPGQGKVPAVKTPTLGNTTKATPPPKHAARGAGGKTQVGADTKDFAAFERMAMSGSS